MSAHPLEYTTGNLLVTHDLKNWALNLCKRLDWWQGVRCRSYLLTCLETQALGYLLRHSTYMVLWPKALLTNLWPGQGFVLWRLLSFLLPLICTPLFVAWRVCCHFLKLFGRERYFYFFTVLLALNIQVGITQAIQVFASDKHCPIPCGSLHSQWRGINSFTAIHWDKTSTITVDVVLVSCIPPIPCSCEQPQAVGCCCFWSFPQQLHETGMMLVRTAADQPALTGSLRKWGAGDPFAPSRGAEQETAVYSNTVQCWEADTSQWVPQLRELLPSALRELNSFSKWKLRIWMCEQRLPGKAFDLPWVSQQEEFSSLEVLPGSDHGTLNFCSAEQFLPPHSLFPLTVLWLPRGLKPLWWGGIQRFSCLWLRVPPRASFSLLFW